MPADSCVYNEAMPTSEQVREALKVVNDPEIGINIVDLGLVYDVEVTEDGEAHITHTLTSMGCPLGPIIDGEIKEALGAMEGVNQVTTELVWQPQWGPDKMSEFAKSALGFF
jgi:metal-sulfur cluster biosynthetic enzyme